MRSGVHNLVLFASLWPKSSLLSGRITASIIALINMASLYKDNAISQMC